MISYMGIIFLLYFLVPIFWYLITPDADGTTHTLDIGENAFYVWLVSIFYFTETHNEYFVFEMVAGTILSILAHKAYKQLT